METSPLVPVMLSEDPWPRTKALEVFVPPPSVARVTDGTAQIASPRQNVEVDAPVPLFRFATGRFPVTPVVSGKPVTFVAVITQPAVRQTLPVPLTP